VEIGKSKNLPIAKISPNSPKNLPISNPLAKVQFPSPKILKNDRSIS
jgi:hypothetical protein